MLRVTLSRSLSLLTSIEKSKQNNAKQQQPGFIYDVTHTAVGGRQKYHLTVSVYRWPTEKEIVYAFFLSN